MQHNKIVTRDDKNGEKAVASDSTDGLFGGVLLTVGQIKKREREERRERRDSRDMYRLEGARRSRGSAARLRTAARPDFCALRALVSYR